jgi:hypothetical protein
MANEKVTDTGTLGMFGNDSRFKKNPGDNGTLLIISTGDNPAAIATKKLRDSGFANGSPITITGTPTAFKGDPAIELESFS